MLGEKVTAAREERGFSQTELANRAGIQRKSLQNIEYARSSMKDELGRYGHGNPKLDTIYSIAAALEIDIAYLVDPGRSIEPLADAS
jgi:transcriptional regulator with XRE-family HTH domain